MSHIADALHRLRAAPIAEPFDEDDQPWGDDLLQPLADAPDFHLPFRELVEPRIDAPLPRITINSRLRSALHPAVDEVRSALDGLTPAVRDQLSALATRVFLGSEGRQTRSIAFAPVDGSIRSGAITTAAAEILSQQTTGSVCVLDAKIAAPTLHSSFGVAYTPGLADALASGLPLAAAALPLRTNLSLLPSGAADGPVNLTSDSARLQLAQFFAAFDYVLIDMFPVLTHGAGTIAPLVDGIILVMNEATRREAARRAAQIVRDAGASVLGAVLTDRRFPIPERIYRRL